MGFNSAFKGLKSLHMSVYNRAMFRPD